MAASAIAKGLTQLLSRNVGARMSAPVYAGEPIEQTLKLQKFAQKQAQQLGPEDASKIIGEGEEGLPLIMYHRVRQGSEPFQKFKGRYEEDSPVAYDFISTGLSKKGMANWTGDLSPVHRLDREDSGERVAIGMGKVNKLFDHNNPDHVNDLFKQLRKNFIDERTEAKNRGIEPRHSRIRDIDAELKKRKESVKRGVWLEIEEYDIQEALKDLRYDSFTTIESGKNVMLLNPNEQFVPLFDPLKKSAIGFSRGGGLSSLNEKV